MVQVGLLGIRAEVWPVGKRLARVHVTREHHAHVWHSGHLSGHLVGVVDNHVDGAQAQQVSPREFHAESEHIHIVVLLFRRAVDGHVADDPMVLLRERRRICLAHARRRFAVVVRVHGIVREPIGLVDRVGTGQRESRRGEGRGGVCVGSVVCEREDQETARPRTRAPGCDAGGAGTNSASRWPCPDVCATYLLLRREGDRRPSAALSPRAVRAARHAVDQQLWRTHSCAST